MDFLYAVFSGVNLPYTILLLANLLYWLAVMIGSLDTDQFNIDLDHDLDVHVEADGDMDAEVGHLPHAVIGALKFFHVGEVPLMILVSFFSLSLWTLAMLAHGYLDVTSPFLMIVLFFPNAVVSLFLTKVLTLPLRAFYMKMLEEEGAAFEDLHGKICTVSTSCVDSDFGQAEVKTDGAPIILNVRSKGDEKLLKGDEAVIMEKGDGIYYIKKIDI